MVSVYFQKVYQFVSDIVLVSPIYIIYIYIYTHRIHVWYIFTYLCYKKSTKCITVNIHGSYGILIFLRGDILLVATRNPETHRLYMVNIPIICKVFSRF